MVKPEYQESEVGVIPKDWEIHYLDDLGDVISGGTPKTIDSECWNGDIAWCTPSDITSTKGKYISTTERFITDKGLKNSAATLMPSNSLLICTRATIGELKICTIPMATNQGFKNLRSNGHANVNFLYYLLQTKREKMYELAIGSTFLEISKSAICQIPLQCPPLEEQQKIAEALSDMDELIASLDKLIAKKKAIKQGAMQELLTGKKRLPGFDGKWGKVELAQVCSHITDGSHVSPQGVENGYYMPSVKDMRTNSFDYSECKSISFADYKMLEKNGCRPKIGDILIAKDGSILKYAFVQKKDEKIVILSSIAIIRSIPSVVDSYFIAQFFKQEKFIEETKTNYKSGTGVPRIVLSAFKKIPLYIPKLIKEQQNIASILSDMDAEIEALEQKLSKCRQTKQGMMQQLLTGKIRLV